MKKNFPPKKAEMYSEALDSPFDPSQDGKVTGFVKKEWVRLVLGKLYKPRAIQFRTPRFLAWMYVWYKGVEEVIYNGRYLFNRRQARTCAKGRNPHDRIKDLLEQVSRIPRCCVVGLDGSAFDAHVSQDALDLEWKWYTQIARLRRFPKHIRRLIYQQWRCQRVNRCKARLKDGKVSYKVKGNRMSGDLNTAGGNSLLQQIYLAAWAVDSGVPDENWGMYVDGDDSVLFVSEEYAPLCAGIPGFFKRFNQEVKMTSVEKVSVDRMEPIEFCQARPVKVNGQWRLIRDPWKQVNVYTRSHRWFKKVNMAKRYFSTICEPEMIINLGVPVLQQFYRQLHHLGEGSRPLNTVARNFYRARVSDSETLRGLLDEEISWETRLSFARAWGVPALEQIRLERLLAVDDKVVLPGVEERRVRPARTLNQ